MFFECKNIFFRGWHEVRVAVCCSMQSVVHHVVVCCSVLKCVAV